MIRAALPALAAAALLGACGQEASDRPQPADSPSTATPPPSTQPATPASPAADAVNDGYPDITPAPLTAEAERSEAGASNVLLAFARGIELKEFDQAWALMSATEKARWSRAQFAALFADLDDLTVAVPGGTMEGAAGSSFYTAPITVTGANGDGRPVRYEGEVVLRRVNDVPGASAEQLRWHINSVTLDWTH